MDVHKSTIPFLRKARLQSAIWPLVLMARSTTGVFSGLGRMKARSILAIAQDPASGTHPQPLTLRFSEKLLVETRSADEALDRLALAPVSDTWIKARENEDGRI